MTIAAKKSKLPIIWTIEGIPNPPPALTMLINPANMDLSFSPLINETRTLGGFIQEFWGEQLTTLSASGQTAIFYDTSGITNKNSRNSESYQNFIKLINIYKNNGKDYSDTFSTAALKANPNKIISFGTIIMQYGGKKYEGFFESFSVKEIAQKPFNLEYDFTFKITKTFGDLFVKDGQFLEEV
jgi:hypothetical protein